METIKNITFIGSGNVAWHLSQHVCNNGFKINQIYSRTLSNAQSLAKKVNASACDNFHQLNAKSDLYIVSIKDDFINEILDKFPFKDKFVVHTSGSQPLSIFKNFYHYGIFYPLQTFSKDKNLGLSNVPVCIEANNKTNEILLLDVAQQISSNVNIINSEQRKKLHLAAVFACNFSNQMYAIAEDILTKEHLDFSILIPLINETARKINHHSPKEMQTGPAKRKDQNTINHHLKMLDETPELQTIYKLITQHIIKKQHE